ncbi:MAG TPA: M56 family metallopeptidase, partial [bacterium]
MEMLIYQIEHLAGKWLEFMVASSVQLGLFLLLIIAITAVFKNQSARFLYWIWLIGLLKIFVPPNIKLPAFLLHSKFVLDNNIPMLFIPEIQLANTTAPGLSYQGYLFLLWVIIIALLFAFWIYKLIRFRSHVTQLCHEITGRIQLDRDMDMLNRVRFFTGPNIDMPFTKGLFAPKVFLPESVLSWRRSELIALIFHELAHIQRKDLLVIVIQNAMQLLYFFHPLVWLANIQISRYREKACDDFAIHAMHGKSLEYGKLLLKSIDHAIGWKPIPSLSTQFHQSKKFLLNRFHYILNRKGNIMTKLKFSQKLALIGLIIFGIALSCQKQTLKETKGTNEKPTRAIQEKPQAEKAKL